MGAKGRTVETILGRLASRSHAVVTREQLLTAGVSRREVQQRLETGARCCASTRRARRSDPPDATIHRGIAITTVPFTIIARAAQLPSDALARACHEAGVRYGTTPRHVEDSLLRRPSAPGTKQLRAVLHGDVRVTLSKLEKRFLQLLQDQGLPLPETNGPASGRRVDYADVFEDPNPMLTELKARLASTGGALPDAPSVVAVPRTKL